MTQVKFIIVGVFNTLLLNINIFSQCTGLTQGISFDNVSGEISGTVTWTADKYVNGDLSITGDLTINAKNIKVAEDVTITVEAGGTLTILNGTDIYGEPDGGGFNLWDGIVVDGDGTLTMDDSQIFYARIAINANNSGDEQSELYITNSCFENNDIGIFFGPDALPDASVSLIEATEFHAPDLVDEWDNQLGDYGILIYLTDHVYGIQVGNNDEYDVDTDNYFHDLGMGIRSLNSDVTVQNCLFEDINTIGNEPEYPDGVPITETENGFFGICATGSENISIPLYLLTVGSSSATDINNKMLDVMVGIYAEEYVSTELHYNELTSTPSGPTYIMQKAIFVQQYDVNVSHDIERNEISWYWARGIECKDVDDGSVFIDDNALINSGSLDFTFEAIRVTGTAETDVVISDNTIDAAVQGIQVMGVTSADVTGNIVDYYGTDSYTEVGHGIRAIDCPEILIQSNILTGNCTSGDCNHNVRAIEVNGCPEFLADKNITDLSVVGIWCQNDVNGGNMTCNEMNIPDYTAQFGVLLNNIGTIGSVIGPIESSPGEPSDNGWFPDSDPVYRIAVAGSTDASTDEWFYDDDADWSDIPIGLCFEFGLAVCPLLDEESGFYCDLPFRTEEITNERLILLDHYFGEWVKEVVNSGIHNNNGAYYRAWSFWNYLKNDTELQVLLEDDFLEAFNLVSESNIPVFDELSHMIGIQNAADALELNAGISPGNDIEEIWQEVTSIYLNAFDENDNFLLGDAELSRLNEIAILNPYDFGPGVYHSWKLLDIMLSTNITIEEKSGDLIVSNEMFVYPNPATDYVYIEAQLNNDEKIKVTVTDLIGRGLLIYDDYSYGDLLNVSKLPSGLYKVKISYDNGLLLESKLVIFKPNK